MPYISKKEALAIASTAYLAGMIDGEGSITITEHCRTDRPGYMRRSVRLQIYNTDERLLRSLQAEFGGVIYLVRRPLEKWKDQFSLTWSEAKIVEPLMMALPFLRLKRQQAQMALEYQSHKLPASAGRRAGQSEPVAELMTELHAQMRVMNRRGKDAIQHGKTS